jgi:hypothetical protein
MSFRWEKRRVNASTWFLLITGSMVSLLSFITLAIIGLEGMLNVILGLISVAVLGTCLAFLFINFMNSRIPDHLYAYGELTPLHIRLYFETMSAQYGPPINTDFDPDHIEIYFLRGIFAMGFEYNRKKGEIKTRRDDSVTRPILDDIDDRIKHDGSIDPGILTETSIRELDDIQVSRNQQRGAVVDRGSRDWKKNGYNSWMMFVVACWFIAALFAFAAIPLTVSMVTGIDPRYLIIGLGVIILLLLYPIIKFAWGRTEKKGSFQSPELYRLTANGLEYRAKAFNMIGRINYGDMRKVTVSTLIKVVRVEPKRSPRTKTMYESSPIRINEYRFMMTTDDRERLVRSVHNIDDDGPFITIE